MDMKCRTIYGFSADSIARSFKSFISSLILCIGSFVLIGVSSYAYDLTRYGERSVDDILQEGVEGTGTLSIEDDHYDEKMIESAYRFCREANELEELKSIGNYSYAGVDYRELKELSDVQKKHGATLIDYINNVEVLVMNSSLLPLVKLPLAEGMEITSMSDEGDYHELYVYLGSNFSHIPIGTTYDIKNDDTGKLFLRYCVKGILQKGARWMSEDVLFRTETLNAITTVPLDNMVICIAKDDYATPTWTYSLSDGATFEQAEQKLKEVAAKHGLTIHLGTARATFDEIAKANGKITSYAMQLFGMIMVTTFVVMMCTQLAGMLNHLSEYGTLYANGASTGDLLGILLVENIIKVVAAFLLASILCHVFLTLSIVNAQVTPTVGDMYLEILYRYTYIKMALVGVAFTICLSAVPMVILRRMNPNTLLGGNEL